MDFLALTKTDGRAVRIQKSNVEYIEPGEKGGTRIGMLSGKSFTVMEKYPEVWNDLDPVGYAFGFLQQRLRQMEAEKKAATAQREAAEKRLDELSPPSAEEENPAEVAAVARSRKRD